MKTLFVLIIGIAIGVGGYYYYQQRNATVVNQTATAAGDLSDSARTAAQSAAAKTRAAAANLSDAFNEKIQQWHLTPADIRADLAKSGEVARDNTAHLRAEASDAKITTVIKSKLVLDRDLAARNISVQTNNGDVLLTGTVGSEELVGRAVALAMDTDGVRHVKAKLAVTAQPAK